MPQTLNYIDIINQMIRLNPYSDSTDDALKVAVKSLADDSCPKREDIKKMMLLFMDYALAVGFNKEHMDVDVITDYILTRWSEYEQTK